MDTKKALVNWIKKQVSTAKAKGCVVGLSGGIDSAVVSVLCAKAVGAKNVQTLILPCHSQKQDITDARLLARTFKLPCKLVDLGPIYDLLLKSLPKSGNQLSKANLKPRLRMMILYYFANNSNSLVVGTGNKSELSVGYFTKYGDGGVDILPMGRFYKKDVVRMAKELNIPDRIITKPPSAGLWQGQTDEDEMGISYDQLDGILRAMYAGKPSKSKPAEKVKNMFKSSNHKRALPPVF